MKKMPKKVLLALVAALVLSIGAAVAVFADTAGVVKASGDGAWYYAVTVGETETSDTDSGSYTEFWVELCDENGDWFTTTSTGGYWTYDDDATLTVENFWYDYGTEASLSVGDEVIVEIVRDGKNIIVTYFVNGSLYYSVRCEGATFTDSVTWQVNVQSGTVTVSDLKEGQPETDRRTITDVAVKSLSKTEFIVGSQFDMSGTVLTITYADGTTADLTVGEDWWTEDAYGNEIAVFSEGYVIDEEGDSWYDSNSPNNPVYYAGTYAIKVEIESYNLVKFYFYSDYLLSDTITVREATTEDAVSATALELDNVYDVTVDDQWFVYTPTKSGYYVFKSLDGADLECVALYVEHDDGTLELWTNNWGEGTDENIFRVFLNAGTTYYYRTMDYYGSFSVYQVSFGEAKTVASIAVESLSKTEFVQYMDSFELAGSVITVTYTDGSTATLTIDRSYSTQDEYGNYFYYYLKGDDYEVDYYSRIGLDPGTYAVTFMTEVYDETNGWMTVTDSTQSINVVSVEDSSRLNTISLLDEECTVEVENEGNAYYSFTPANDGTYYFVVNFYLDEDDQNLYWGHGLYYYDEDGNWTEAEFAYDENGEMLYYTGTPAYVLKSGVTYYYYINPTIYWMDEDGNYNSYAEDATVKIVVSAQEVNHEHSYKGEVIVWNWSDDYTSATASLRCDTCSHIEATVDAVVTCETLNDGTVVYTLTAVINGVTYTETKTVEPEENNTSSTPGNDTDTPSGGDAASNSGDGNTNSTGDTGSTGGTSPKTADVSTVGYCVILLGAAVVIAVLAKKRANA